MLCVGSEVDNACSSVAKSDLEKKVLSAKIFLSSRCNHEAEVHGQSYILYANMSFNRAWKLMGRNHGVTLCYRDGALFAVDYTSPVHARVSQEVVYHFRSSHNGAVARLLHAGGGESVRVNAHCRQPDASLIPSQRPPSASRCPTIVVEVAVSQSLEDVYSAAADYFHASTNVQGVVVVKIWDMNASLRRSMLYMYFERRQMGAPTLCVSFGTAGLHHAPLAFLLGKGVPAGQIRGNHPQSQDAPCTHANMPIYEVALDVGAVFTGSTSMLPALQGNSLVCDLFEVQQVVLSEG